VTSTNLIASGSGLDVGVAWSHAAAARLTMRLPGQSGGRSSAQPLVEALVSGQGRSWSGSRYVATVIGQRLRYAGHGVERSGAWQTLSLTQRDDATALEFTSCLSVHDDQCGLRSVTRVHNTGSQPVTLHAVTSLVFADFGRKDSGGVDAMTLLRGRSDWLAEGRWVDSGLRAAGLPTLSHGGRPLRSRGCIEAASISSWPTACELPTAVIADTSTGARWSFQIEHNGAWLWQIGELADGLYLALLGPTDEHHQWQLELAPGELFETVPATLALETGQGGSSLRGLTAFRRVSRPAPRAPLTVVFNDYMNTVNGDPSAEVLHPLIDAAARSGAGYFVIDAGWYADNGDWWDSVGEWEPSARRFPEGIDSVFQHIHRSGMVAGLWLEPEVVGVTSPVAGKLPDAAFLQRNGVRVSEHGRYHLDFSNEAAVTFLDGVIDRLVGEHGVGYFKFDYNIRAGVGSDAAMASAGHGLLRHNRGYLRWIDGLRERHPDLVLENCASGGMRQDFATLSRFDLQSTSDQEDLHAYAPVAAAAPMLVLPEQAANWAYPQPGMSDDDIVYTLCTAILGRFYLSGWLSRLSKQQQDAVAEAVSAHRRLLPGLSSCTPFWPLGLPGWDDEWVVLGLHDEQCHTVHLTIWRRAGVPGGARLPLPALPAGLRWDRPAPVFPAQSPLTVALNAEGNAVEVTDDAGRRAARVVTLNARSNP
jgi:alpha-galactosidase